MKNIQYICLLRGINVGGHFVKMEKLRALFEELNFKYVRTYIQSGNIFFESEESDQTLLRNTIEKQLKSALGYDVPTCIRTIDEFEKIMEANPFKNIELKPDMRFSIIFLSEPSSVDLPIPYKTPDGAYELIGKTATELFVVWRLINGRPGNSYGHIEKKLNVKATVRFWHTSQKILDAAKKV